MTRIIRPAIAPSNPPGARVWAMAYSPQPARRKRPIRPRPGRCGPWKGGVPSLVPRSVGRYLAVTVGRDPVVA